jgi:hypothetical protein
MQLDERLEQLERRVAKLEGQLHFYDYIKDKGLNCTGIIRHWFKFNQTLSPGVLVHETKRMYEDVSYRMAIHRMTKAGELIQARRSIYTYNDKYIPPELTRDLSEQAIQAIKADTTHSHGEIARLHNTSSWTVRKLGHKSPYKKAGT